MSFGVTDAVTSTLHTALNGLSLRQNVIANDIANVDTPGFRATSVNFEASLRAAIERGVAPTQLEATETPTDTPVGADGNNVDLRKEMVASIQTQYSYQVLGRAVTDHLGLLSTATQV